MDSLNSFGNTETIPPYTLGDKSYPLGRLFRGSVPSFYPDKKFSKMMEAQQVQPPVYVDTSWLLVGHVDETISFVKANTPRGWAMVINDPALAKKMLEDQVAKGNGDVTMFVGKKWINFSGSGELPAEISIADVLADKDIMAESAASGAEVDNQVAILKKETGITDDEIIRLPYLHENVSGYSLAYQVGTVNGIYLSDTDFGSPKPHGPVIDGKDIFEVQMTEAFAKIGLTVHYIEDWDLYHRLSGEVHCGSNTIRKVSPDEKWWESGYLEPKEQTHAYHLQDLPPRRRPPGPLCPRRPRQRRRRPREQAPLRRARQPRRRRRQGPQGQPRVLPRRRADRRPPRGARRQPPRPLRPHHPAPQAPRPQGPAAHDRARRPPVSSPR
jgi:hypothetical protein